MIAATNVDLKTAIGSNLFRQDLYDRLGVMHIHFPPLRERGEDIRLMAVLFLKQAAAVYGKPIRGYTAEAIEAICAYSWPGNVRELSNRVKRAVVMPEGLKITPCDPGLACEAQRSTGSLDSLRAAHRRIEVELIVKAMSIHRGNLTRVAHDLEVSRSTLYRKIRVFHLERLIRVSELAYVQTCTLSVCDETARSSRSCSTFL
jgi:two-component system NtrC family response regulator